MAAALKAGTTKRSLLPWIAGSVVVALVGFIASSALFHSDAFSLYWGTNGIRLPVDLTTLFWASFICGGLWLILLVAALVRVGRRGLWILLTGPVALYGPVLLALIVSACAFDHSQCP